MSESIRIPRVGTEPGDGYTLPDDAVPELKNQMGTLAMAMPARILPEASFMSI